jgi:copper(I)-binding protein
MTRRVRRLGAPSIVAGFALLSACGQPGPDRLTISDAWVRATPPVATNAAAYVTVTSPIDDAITGVTVPEAVAGRAVIHVAASGGTGDSMAAMPGMDHGSAGDAMSMAPVRRVDLPAGKTLALTPGRAHIMLVDLRAPLVTGSTVPITVEFAHAPARVVRVPVRDNPP